jgi:hypothetical protein
MYAVIMIKNCLYTVINTSRANNLAVGGGIPAGQLMKVAGKENFRKSHNVSSRAWFWLCMGRVKTGCFIVARLLKDTDWQFRVA